MVTFSLVFIFGVLAVFLLRFKVMGFGGFLVAALFGFYLSQTGAADVVRDVTVAVVEAVSSIGSTGGDA